MLKRSRLASPGRTVRLVISGSTLLMVSLAFGELLVSEPLSRSPGAARAGQALPPLPQAATTVPAGAQLRGKAYVALGDSISVGSYASTPAQTFPSRIAAELGMRLVVLAQSGARAAWALPRLGALEEQNPALVTIELGTNDVGFNTPPAEFAGEYEAIVMASAAPGRRVLCIGSWLPGSAIDTLIEDTCDRHGGTFVSLEGFYSVGAYHSPQGEATFRGRGDWFHPGSAGHAAIAAAALARLWNPVFRRGAACAGRHCDPASGSPALPVGSPGRHEF